MSRLAALTILATLIAISSSSAAPPRPPAPASVGFWSANPEWPVEQVGRGQGGYCIATTKPVLRPGETYQVALKVGQPSEVRLTSNEPIRPDLKAIAIEFPDGGGFDFYELKRLREGGRDVLVGVMTGSMMKLVVDALRQGTDANLVVGEKRYPLPSRSFASTFEDLKACERHRLGLILGD